MYKLNNIYIYRIALLVKQISKRDLGKSIPYLFEFALARLRYQEIPECISFWHYTIVALDVHSRAFVA